MKKRILSLLCAIALMVSLAPAALAATSSQTLAADTLYTLGLFKGNASGYDLDARPTRLHAMVMVSRLCGGEGAKAEDYSHPFTDIPAWAEGYVGFAYEKGLARGVDATTFDSSRLITANAYYAFLLRLLGYSDAEGDFSIATAALFAYRLGIAPTANDPAFTRGDMCEATLGALTAPLKGEDRTLISLLIEEGTVEKAVANALGLSEKSRLTAREISDRCSAPLFLMHCYVNSEEVSTKTPSSRSSGFFISADGIAVTCYHSIAGVIGADVEIASGERFPVEKVLYYDIESDTAVLKVSTTSLDGVTTAAFPYLETASVDTVYNGDPCFTVSHALSLQFSVTNGIVSNRAQEAESLAIPMIQTTAPISRGSSGAPLLNEFGEVIGIISAYFAYGNDMYLSIPIDVVLEADLTQNAWTLKEVADLTAVEDIP